MYSKQLRVMLTALTNAGVRYFKHTDISEVEDGEISVTENDKFVIQVSEDGYTIVEQTPRNTLIFGDTIRTTAQVCKEVKIKLGITE